MPEILQKTCKPRAKPSTNLEQEVVAPLLQRWPVLGDTTNDDRTRARHVVPEKDFTRWQALQHFTGRNFRRFRVIFIAAAPKRARVKQVRQHFLFRLANFVQRTVGITR